MTHVDAPPEFLIADRWGFDYMMTSHPSSAVFRRYIMLPLRRRALGILSTDILIARNLSPDLFFNLNLDICSYKLLREEPFLIIFSRLGMFPLGGFRVWAIRVEGI